ncbi:alpha/beta-hydrolase [Dentipellis sp. KUC8613]|nr:alpha/beta-hydrolase [Dentipellis sp. KUC8613]
MHIQLSFSLLLASTALAGFDMGPVNRLRNGRLRLLPPKFNVSTAAGPTVTRRAEDFYRPQFSNPKAASFHVNSSALPYIDFPLQDSWAGRLPVSNKTGDDRVLCTLTRTGLLQQLFFWYWPSAQSTESDSFTIWLNGGPGCSSLAGFLQENGPISFKPGAQAPTANQYAWTEASDVIWIDQPVGTGFSVGTQDIQDENDLADEFYGFLTQFYSVFPELAKKKLYITGESYAVDVVGMYIPYIATRILQASAAEQAALPLSLQGLLINDGVYSSFVVDQEAPVAQFAKTNQQAIGLSDSEVANLARLSASCGRMSPRYDDMLAQVTYPPKGKILLPGNSEAIPGDCEMWGDFAQDAYGSNPCFNVYRYTDECPAPSDGSSTYLSLTALQKALHIPNSGVFSECSDDLSPYSEGLMPDLLAKLPRGITLWHGLLDALLFNLGDRLTVQNLTWNGAQGFSAPPTTPLIVGGSQRGVYRSERNLTYIEVDGAGHMIPGDQPETALHVFQAVLGQTAL